ncbi:GNAT family N-acetyltransferase [Fictibacillus aquaticus]|uniref:RimJ/RimL family protein N-acetyltransferase n=1 Tax=Fictibacillus aquaticus TaxID=2021314 RepID=A0A235FE56_9BACL|nr:GNAT family protein [Fictibacillus aquaticus]OYD59492.1 RimJ/RimL family protein N-acetyltransferase [Fictibacillus aquaticus]
MFTYQIDEDIHLRLLNDEDAGELAQLIDTSRPYLKEWLGWVEYSTTEQDSREFIRAGRKNYAENVSMTAAIIYKGKIAGVAGFHQISWSNRNASIGYWLGEGFQGKGLMTKAVEALVKYAFEGMEMNRVEIRAAVENKKSRAIPERLGFTEEGLIRQSEFLYDHYVDHIVYGMLADEWQKRSENLAAVVVE